MLLAKYVLINIIITFISAHVMVNNLQNDVIGCVENIYFQNNEKHTFLLSQTKELYQFKNSSGLIIYSEDSLESIENLWKMQSFIFLIDNITRFNNSLINLSRSKIWNARAKFIIGYLGNELIDLIFKISSKYYISNIAVVQNNISAINIYTYYPYQGGNCGNFYKYELLTSCKNENFNNVFVPKIPVDLHGCEIKVMAYTIQPYVINISNPNEKSAKAGVEVTILYNVAKKMNISLRYLKNPHRHWGYRFPDGNFSLMYKDLKDRVTDMIYGFTYGNSSYNDDFDASFCHLSESSVWFFPTAGEMARWKNLTNIFEKRLWIAIFFMFFFNGLFWWVIGRNREPSKQFNDFVLCEMSSLYVLLQGAVKSPQTWNVRLMFFLWLLTCLLIFTAHQCQLVSILTTTLYEAQITTLEELVASGSEFGFYPTIKDAYKDNSSFINRAIYNHFQTCPLTEECLNRTAFHRDYAVVKNRRQVMYLMPRIYTFPNGRPMLYDTDIAAFTTRERYYVFKGFPFLERFDNILMLLISNGLIDKWDRDTRYFNLKVEGQELHESLKLDHLEGAFFVYIFGMIFAFLTVIVEILTKIISKNYNHKIKNQITLKM